MQKLKRRKKTRQEGAGTGFPDIHASGGFYPVPDAHALADDEGLCVQLATIERPDFESLAAAQYAKAAACSGFHPHGIDQLWRKLAQEYNRYVEEVDEAAARLKAELDTTHRASLEAMLVVCSERLAEIGCADGRSIAAVPDRAVGNSCNPAIEL